MTKIRLFLGLQGVTKTLASMNLRQAWDQAEDALCAQLDAMCEAGSKALEVKVRVTSDKSTSETDENLINVLQKHGQIHGVFEVVPLSLVAGVTEAKPSSTTSALRKKSPHPESSPIPSNLVDEGYPDDGMEVREDANDVRPQTPSGYPLSSSTSTGSDAHHPASRGPDELTPLRVIRLKTSVHTSSIPVHCSNPSEPVLETLTVKHMTPEKAKHRMRKGLVKVSEEEKSSRRKQSSPSSARPVAEAGGREIRSTGLKADDMDWVRTVRSCTSRWLLGQLLIFFSPVAGREEAKSVKF